MSDSLIPGYALTVLVPVSNPDTAPVLLQLGAALTHPDEGRLIALFVSLGETEKEARLVDQINPTINDLRGKCHSAELQVHVSTSISRGILDIAREEHADLLVLGARQDEKHHSRLGRAVERVAALLPGHDKAHARESASLGNVVESVVAVTPCDVLIYRAGSPGIFSRVVIPVDGSLHSAVACRIGILIGEGYHIPVEAVHAQASYHPQWEGRGRIDQSLAGLPGRQTVERSVITASDAAGGILSRINENDLLLVGVSELSTLERWLFGNFTGRVLQSAPGSVMLIRRSTAQSNRQGLFRQMLSRLTPTLTEPEQDEVLWQAFEMASPTLDYRVLISISAILASLGLLLNSTAVIIGAMLVAPLMQPLIGLSVGGVTGQWRVVGRAMATLAQGVILALLTSGIIGILAAGRPVTPEMLARGNPGVLDGAVALASGFVGAYATARKDIPSALAGVAIAAALVPPLCTTGLSFGAGNIRLGVEAGLLFVMNIAGISVSGILVFYWLGVRPHRGRTSPPESQS